MIYVNEKCGTILPATILLIVILLSSPMYPVTSQSPIDNSSELINKGTRSTEIIETVHFEVHFNEGKEFYARMIGGQAENVYVESIEFANFTPQEKIPIYIVESNDFDGIWLNRGGYEGISIAFQSEWSLDWTSENHMNQVVAHELNHLLLSRKTNNIYVHNELPIWYCEGLAEYISYKYIGPERETSNKITLKYYCEEDDFQSLDEMRFTSGYDTHVYSEGYSVFKFIEQVYGTESVMLFQENAELNFDTKEGFQRTFNLTQEEFEIDWMEWIITNYTKDVVTEPTTYGHPVTDTNDYDISKRVPTSWCKEKILFVSDKYADFDIFVMNENGTDIQQLTDNNGIIDTDPTWSPDGTKILFTSNRGANYGVYVMNADGTNVIPVVDNQYMNFAGTWSPNCESILFISNRNGNYDIYS
ncbi:MAG: PD40 domain-containing protein, partial [Thermoplasmata archaeon]|nr:PD40 domain-containing protein [Thermoplasmata archaeon]